MALLKEEAIEHFNLEGEVEEIIHFGGGHINDTFRVKTNKKYYILQRINKFVFQQPEQIMENSRKVTEFLQNKIRKEGGDPERETLSFLPAKDGRLFYVDSNGEYWRVSKYIDNTTAHDFASGKDMLFESGYAFGRFQNLLADYPAESLYEVIKDFHNTPARYEQLMNAVRDNKSGRVGDAGAEIEFAEKRKNAAAELMNLLNSGRLPLKVTHNDTKMSNVLIDDVTNKAVCVIDLDTVMPGLTAFDFGDSIRAGASTGAEDEVDLSKVHFSLELFEAYTKGFLKAAGDSLTPLELETLPVGAKLMTYEVGIRFLADYLNGDIYFKTKYPRHNLDRARNQFKLVADMENKWDEMMAVIHQYA